MAAGRRPLKIEPYDPNALDGDGDGIVQDGTAWERPAGVRIFDRSGQEIMPGRVSENPVRDLVYRDQNGSIVDYKPKFRKDKEQQERPIDGLGPTIEERSQILGQDRTLGDRLRQQREREAALAEQQRQQAERSARVEAERQKREQFAEIIRNLPIDGPNQPDSFLFPDGTPEAASQIKQRAQFVFGMLHDALMVKADPDSADAYGRVDPDRVDEQIERLNLASKALFGMGIDGPIDRNNAAGYAELVLNLSDALGKSIDEQTKTLKYAEEIESALDSNEEWKISSVLMPTMNDYLSVYSGFKEAAERAETESKKYKKNQAIIEKQLRNQHHRFLAANNNIDKVIKNREKLKDIWHKRNRVSTPEPIDRLQGPLETLYPGIDLQPNDTSLGNTTETNLDPQNPLPQPTNNELNIDVDIEDLEPNSNVEQAVIVQAAVDHLRNGGSLSDIPNDYWGTVLKLASSDAEIDTDNPFYEVTPSVGAVSLTKIYWRRNPDGTPSDQGWVTKAQPWQFSAADHVGFNIAAALGIYPEGSNWGGTIDATPTDFNDWLDTMPVVVIPIAWNHVPTNGDLSRLEQDPSYRSDSVKQGAAKRHFAAILHTWLIGDKDRNPGNTLTGWMDGEAYVMPIDFGGSGGFMDREPLPEYMGTGEPYGTYNKFADDLQAYLATLTPEERDREVDDLIRTYDAMLQRAEQTLRTNSEEKFIKAMMPQNADNYPDMDQDMMRRELAAAYGGLANGTKLMRDEREQNLRSILGPHYKDTPERSLNPGQIRYTPEQLENAEYGNQFRELPPSNEDVAELLFDENDLSANEIRDALLAIPGIDAFNPDVVEAMQRAVEEDDIQALYLIATTAFSDEWNSNVTTPTSLFFVDMAKEELQESFGIEFGPDYIKGEQTPGRSSIPEAYKPEHEQGRQIVKKIINAQYRATQKHFADEGITEIRVYRGIVAQSGEGTDFPEMSGRKPLEMRPISSWTTDYRIAGGESLTEDSVIIHDLMPVENIFAVRPPAGKGDESNPKHQGFGTVFEREVIPLHTTGEYDYVVKNADETISKSNFDQIVSNTAPERTPQPRRQVDDDDSIFEISDNMPDSPRSEPYTQEQLEKANFQPKQAPPNAPLVGEKFAETTTATAQEIFDALDPIYDDLIEEGTKPDMKTLLQAVKENDKETLGRLLANSLGQVWNTSTTSKLSVVFASIARGEFEKRGIELAPEFVKLPRNPETGEQLDAKDIIENHPINDPEFSRAREIIGEVLMAQYDATQDYLRDNNISEIRVYRGLYVLNDSDSPFDIDARSGSVTTAHRTLSSWGIDLEAADAFAVPKIEVDGEPPNRDGYGVILHDVIPAEEVFAIATQKELGPRKKTKKPQSGGRPAWQDSAFGEPTEDEIIRIGTRRATDYVIKPNDTEITQEDIDRALLNPEENDFAFEISDDLPETPEPPQPPTLGNYTQQQLDDADYDIRPVDVVPPTTKNIAQQAAQNSIYSPAETAEALHLAGIFPKFEGQYPFKVQQAVENNDIETIYEQALDTIEGIWNGQVTEALPEFFKDMVKEELQEAFGIEFGTDYARGDKTPGQRKLPQAYTPETERARQIIKQIANSYYQSVQQYLADQGITEVRIYRGISTNTGEGTDFPESAGTRQLEMRPLSSWTTDYQIAARFTGYGATSSNGVILHQVVPAKYIFSIRPADSKLTPENRLDAQGLGTTHESELIPIHSKLPYDYIVTRREKLTQEEIDNILTGKTTWTAPPKQELPPIPTQVTSENYLNLTNAEMYNIDTEILTAGMTVYNTDQNQFFVWTGKEWKPTDFEPDEIVG